MKPKRTEAELNAAKTKLLVIMSQHVGAAKVIGMGELYEAVFEQPYGHRINGTRDLRKLVTDLRHDGVPICSVTSHSSPGYYLAAAGSELDDYTSRDKRRALKILAKVAKIRDLSMPELLGQMALELAPRVQG